MRTVGWRKKIHRDESLNFEISDGHLGLTRDESLNFESLDHERRKSIEMKLPDSGERKEYAELTLV